jgi:7-cyano-7-deazaguanine synthase
MKSPAEAGSRPAIVCLSGGMDSTSLLLHLLARGHDVYGLSFDYGQRHLVELAFLERNLRYLGERGLEVHHETVRMPELARLFESALLQGGGDVPLGHYEEASMRATVVPNRNAIFASIAFGWALSIALRTGCTTSLSLGVHAGDHAIYPDCRPEFYQQLWQAFVTGNWDAKNVELHLPYLHCDKAAILRDAIQSCEKLALDFDEVFSRTVTSYLPGVDGAAHGLTGSDVERILAFHAIGRCDPVRYAQGWDAALAQALDLAHRRENESLRT